ncbi:DUF6228 family protein [Amycolatopsis carbonis]|uniref:DUF6228 family protein n=1 Tax=Amycolatopsis carbonis TaxID=715471 RepID=A0A9Y2IRE8_9PSEU|nr:DUF6228 family protein [Amycolatopsis sp. 2-15]WIX84079.1 DUF6228 family protein [Amycolatopsis sp. 2-15]
MTIPARLPAGTFVKLERCRRPHDDALGLFGARVEAPGLSASLEVETLNGDGLDSFVQSLGNDFRGWTDERIWASFRGDLELRASHSGRLIWLSWTLRFPEPTEEDPAVWTATVRVHLTPGEDLRVFNSDVAAFLNV